MRNLINIQSQYELLNILEELGIKSKDKAITSKKKRNSKEAGEETEVPNKKEVVANAVEMEVDNVVEKEATTKEVDMAKSIEPMKTMEGRTSRMEKKDWCLITLFKVRVKVKTKITDLKITNRENNNIVQRKNKKQSLKNPLGIDDL